MEENLIKAIEEKIENLKETKLEKIEEMKKEQKIDVAYVQLNKRKEEALAEIRSHGNGSKEASIDLEKIETELEKVKMAESNIIKKVEKEISTTKGYLTEVNGIISKRENAQKENEKVEKDIEKLIQYKNEALTEIRNHGNGSKEASIDLEKIETELKNKNEIKEKNKRIIEQSNEKIDKFMQRSDIKKILKEKLNKDWEEKIKENADFDKQHNNYISDENEQSDGKNQGQNQGKSQEQAQNTKYNMILDISGNTINVNENGKSSYKEELKNKEELIEKYAIGSYFYNDKRTRNNIDYALISALEKIDDKDKSLVKAYLKIIKYGKSQSNEVKESIEKLNKAVDIEYKFNKSEGKLLHLKEKRIARYAKKIGIASLDGISEKSLWDKTKEIFSRMKGKNLFKFRKEPVALGSGEEIKEPANDKFRSEVEVGEDVKHNIDDVSKEYLKQEKEQEMRRAKDVEKMQNEDKVKRLQSDEYEEIKPSDNNGLSR